MSQITRLGRQATYFLPLMLLIAVVGFWPTYFTALQSTRTSVHVHGFLMLTWMAALPAQAVLFRTGQLAWHRRIGRMSFAIAPLIIVVGLLVTHESLARAGSNLTRTSLEVFTISMTSIFAFGLVYALAIYYRRQPHLHARYMVGTGLMLIGAGILRIFQHWIPGFSNFSTATHGGIVIVELAIIGLIFNDSRIGRIRAPYIIVLLLTVWLHAMFWKAPEWGWWRGFALWVGQAA